MNARESILRAALRVIGEQGVAGLSNRRIVAEPQRLAGSIVALLSGLQLRRLATGETLATPAAEALTLLTRGGRGMNGYLACSGRCGTASSTESLFG